MFHKKLTWACDLIILNACCMTALHAWLLKTDWLWGLSLLNCLAVIALRHWLMSSLQIPWLDSWLNRGLRRATDILVALTFLLTLFPLIIIIQAIAIRTNKRHKGALLCQYNVCVGEEKNFRAFLFRNCSAERKYSLGMTPLALQLLTGTITLGELSAITIMPAEEEDDAETYMPEEKLDDAENTTDDKGETEDEITDNSEYTADTQSIPKEASDSMEQTGNESNYASADANQTSEEYALNQDEPSTNKENGSIK